MSTVLRSVNGYQAPFAGLNTHTGQAIGCKKSDLYRCAVTVGNPTFFSLNAIRTYGLLPALCTSIFDKCSIVASNIEKYGTVLRRGAIYDTHVSDIKRQVSYSLGMAFAKFHAERLLGIHNLIHLEFLKRLNAVTFIQQPTTNRPQEPDLVGQSADGSWHIFEAKGTSYQNNVAAQVAGGKIQAAQIATIHGQVPTTRTVSGTYIGRDRIETYLQDPSDSGSSAIAFEQNDYNKAYYAPFFIGLPDVREVLIDGVLVRMFNIRGSTGTASIGLTVPVFEALQNQDTTDLPSALPDPSVFERGSDQYSFGLDGFVVGFKADD